MKVRIQCSNEDCGWVHECEVVDIPPVCPECHSVTVRYSEPDNPENSDVKSAIEKLKPDDEEE